MIIFFFVVENVDVQVARTGDFGAAEAAGEEGNANGQAKIKIPGIFSLGKSLL